LLQHALEGALLGGDHLDEAVGRDAALLHKVDPVV
jgi:hypothetical protein